MIASIAGWVAPAATMIAAMMTAANLGARVTGWGFVVFAIGAVAWIVDALATGQQNLLYTNAFLLLVDVIGIWRWLGRQGAYDDGARRARGKSASRSSPTLFPVSALVGKRVTTTDDQAIGAAVEAMAACDTGAIAYVVVGHGGVGGVGETLHAVGWDELSFHDDALRARVPAEDLERRPPLDRTNWPATAALAGAR